MDDSASHMDVVAKRVYIVNSSTQVEPGSTKDLYYQQS